MMLNARLSKASDNLLLGCAVIIVLMFVKADDRPTGYLFYTSNVINLNLNQTTYTIGCTINHTGSVETDAISRDLTMLDLRRIPYVTEVINDTTIIHKMNLQNNGSCGVKEFICRLNRSMIDSRTFYVGKPPPPIQPIDFKCISYNRKRLLCQFNRQYSCRLVTDYHLSMIRLNSHNTCNLTDNGTTLSFDSNSDTCVFSSGHRSLSFMIEATNIIGKTESMLIVDHFDIVQPEKPSNLHVSSLEVTSANITWSMSYMLYNLNRSFEIEFNLISKYDVHTSFKNIILTKNQQLMHQFKDLFAFTNYTLKMRARVVPKSERHFEDEYWSEWASVSFHTKACPPYEPPRVFPGAYSFKERRENLVTVVVYWEQVPEYHHNGPGFGYAIYARSNTGHNLTVNNLNNGVALFQKARTDEVYNVYFSSYNNEGRSENINIMKVYPHLDAYQPKIRRMFYNDSYHLQWFPADNAENLSNYTIMYCTYSTTGSCHGSIQFDTLPANATSYVLNSNKPLTFALAVNYQWHSSELTWPMCTVSPASTVNQITFKFSDITEHSLVLHLQLSCMDQYLIDQLNVRYWPTKDYENMVNQTYLPYNTIILINDLLIDTDYEVVVTAYDDRGHTSEAKSSVRTKNKEFLVELLLFLLFGMLVMAFIATTATRRVKKIMNIKVEIPTGLLGIDEVPYHNKPLAEEFGYLPELFNDTIELEKLSSSDDKSNLEKPDLSCPSNQEHLSLANGSNPAIQRLGTSNNYIKPSNMVNLRKSITSRGENHSSGGSSGYVDVNLLINQQRLDR